MVTEANDGDWMPYRGCLLVAALVKMVFSYTYADKTSIEVCISSYWLQLFMHKFRDGLIHSLKTEAIFLVSEALSLSNTAHII